MIGFSPSGSPESPAKAPGGDECKGSASASKMKPCGQEKSEKQL